MDQGKWLNFNLFFVVLVDVCQFVDGKCYYSRYSFWNDNAGKNIWDPLLKQALLKIKFLLIKKQYEVFWNNKYYEYLFKTSKKIFFFPKRF